MVLAVTPDRTSKAQELLAQSARETNGDPALLAFFEALYRNATSEDVTRYTPQELTALARLVFARVVAHKPDTTVVALFDPAAEAPIYTRDETVLVAVNDDMPFLFDSLMGEARAQGARLRAVFHPIITMGGKATSVIVAVLDPIVGDERREALKRGAEAVFNQVHEAVRDWRPMQDKLKQAIAELKAHPPRVPAEELAESVAFLEWLGDNHFTFLGCRDYTFSNEGDGRLDPVLASGVGVLADQEARVLHKRPDRARLTPQVRAFLLQPTPLIIAKSNRQSLVHRRVSMDYIGVKTFDKDGALTGERRFIGLFTSGAYSRRPADIPLLRLRVNTVMARAGLPPASHDAKTLAHILDTFPRDELFQTSDDELYTIAMAILRLNERPKTRVLVRFDRFDRFVSALVFVPRERYNEDVGAKIHAILARAFNGRMTAATPALDESGLTHIHYIVGRNEGPRPAVDIAVLEDEIRAAIRTWDDGFSEALRARHGELEGRRLFQDCAAGFHARYRDAFSPHEAVEDLSELTALAQAGRSPALEARVLRKPHDAHSTLRIKLYGLGPALPLSISLPIFENFGLKVIAEDAYPVELKSGEGWTREAFILDFLMERADQGAADLDDIKQPLERAFHAVVAGEAESDGFNRLVIGAGLDWRDVTILRASAKYLRQAGIQFSQDYMEQALARNPDIAVLLVAMFHARCAPDMASAEGADKLYKKIETALTDVQSLDDDRIIRRLRNVIVNVLRTNFYQTDGNGRPKTCTSFKLDSQKLDELPAPRPHVEIFVYSPEVEAVHLRFGKVARGGIRWSDRREDFRTEVLGLVKAQQVKNAVIVPVGAKGGFYPKQMPVNATREEVQAVGVAAYKTFINALLDVTDNLHHDGSVVPPELVVRHDEDDPYFVVAADKGTATFSDTANAIAEGRGFWLGDAFASGGSHGYDHKKMGITAKGAWEAVKRHFRELGRDIQNEAFTCIGVGDMSGDVFGNGMLLSQQTRLVAAFDHRHIFVDPDPDPAVSWAERKRLFDLPRSSWADYDNTKISKGGGVFARTLKQIPLSAEMQALTGLAADKTTPNDFIKALLKAEVDLLFFGGIGTFIKAASQNNLDAGDRANDAVRINGGEVRAKVIGEGANLGLTQFGRVEYAMAGGRLNTDAIDNSAGVDTSDHEVNLKILMGGPLRRGDISPTERDALLAEMTDDVAAHVLKDNYDQTLTLSAALSRAAADLDAHGRFMRDLEARGRLDRAVEFLPDDGELRRRAQNAKGLTRPELSVLLAYAKLDLKAELIAGDLPDDPYFLPELTGYFPQAAAKKFRDELERHRLKREIVTDVIANRVVNLAGPVFVARMKEMSGATAARVIRAFAVAEGAFGLGRLKARIDALDGRMETGAQIGMYADIAELLRRLGLWFITNVPAGADLSNTVALYRGGVENLRGTFSTLISPYEAHDTEARIAALQAAGAPVDVAEDVGVLPLMAAAPEIALLAHSQSLNLDLVVGAYFAMGAEVGIDRLRGLAQRIAGGEHWDRLAIRRISDDLFAGQRALTAAALAMLPSAKTKGGRAEGAEAVKLWAASKADALERAKSFLAALERTGELSVAKLTLANSQIHELAGH
ncbi:MAG: NAD-glutamate dehydrogenase [Alphaproteobacteria bacterium]|nr:NAD-glutamate dehydrogenase [Alphaproteobacteria bacterium]